MAHHDPRPDPSPGGRRARREAERATPTPPAGQPSLRPSPSGADGADRPSPYAATADGPSSPYETGPIDVPTPASSTPGRPTPDAGPAATPTSRRAVRPAGRGGLTGRVAGTLDRRRNTRALTVRQKAAGITATAAMVLTGAVAAANTSSAESPMTRLAFVPTGTYAWYNDLSLGKTDSLDQYAQATVSGLVDADHNAGFFLRYSDRSSRVRVAVSGTVWKIEPAGGTPLAGAFKHNPGGTLRAEIQGQTVRILWNGELVTAQPLQREYTGHAVVATVWQSTKTVQMTALEASSLDAATDAPPMATGTDPATPSTTWPGRHGRPSPSPSTSASPSPSASATPSPSASAEPSHAASGGARGWLSGASGDNLADGGFDRWRGTPAGIAGTWDDGNASVQQELYSICGGQYSSGKWNRALDIAVGGIFLNQGDSWSAAASGAYNARWRTMLAKAKQCWGSRDPSKLFIRFAHEMNLSSSDWGVKAGQEDDFARAFTQFSNVRYDVFPGAQLVLSVNDGSSNGMADVRKLVPGKDSRGRATVNVYGADSYNMWPHCTSESSCEKKFNETADNGAPVGIEKHREFAESKGLPFSVNEYSNNGDSGDADGGGESPAFFTAFYAWARSHSGDVDNPRAGQFLYDCLFNMWKQYQLQPSTLQPQSASTYQHLAWGKA